MGTCIFHFNFPRIYEGDKSENSRRAAHEDMQNVSIKK